ncbi:MULTISPECIES: HGxxPAAW family protein [unclassified Isoptericola]|uniref:HGxxPAAW family protein n=1 Tax=unclassified Isoptericola TaxID=2623355 RepID=UPI0036666867
MTDNRNAEVAYLPPAVPPTNHGHTTAAWTAMIGIMLGVAVGAVGMLPDVPDAVVWVGAVIVAGSLVLGAVLRGMGFGQPKPGVTPRNATSGH